MPTIKSTGNDQRLYLKEDFNGQDISLLSLGGYTYYVPVPKDADWDSISIRTIEAYDPSTAIGTKTYTVADGSLYRVGETVPLYSAASVHKGAITITSISGNVLTYDYANGSDFVAVSGDLLLLRADTKIAEDSISVISTRLWNYLLVKTENSSVELVAEVMFTGVKKKF